MTSTPDPWMLKELTEVPGVRFCLVATSDGIVATHRGEIDRDTAEPVGAACSGFLAIAGALRGQEIFVGTLQQVFIKWGDGYLFVRQAGDRTLLAVVTTADIDPGLIASAMAERIQRIGKPILSTPART